MKILINLFAFAALIPFGLYYSNLDGGQINNTNAMNSIKMIQDIKIDSIIYLASTRGFYEKVIITSDLFALTNSRNGANLRKFSFSADKWEELTHSIEEVGLENISSFDAPSDKRMVDGSPYAHLQIYSGGNIFESQQFDHKNPPKQLSAITDIIYNLSEEVSKQ